MGHTRYYPNCASYIPALSRFLEQRFEGKDHEVQVLEDCNIRNPGRLFQMRPRYRERWMKTLSTYTGLDVAASVTMKPLDDDLEVEIGGAKWLDKAAVAGIGMVASLGLLVLPAGIGAFKQHRLIEDLTYMIDEFFRHRER